MKKIRDFLFREKASPKNNRKKVGRLLFATTIGLFFLFAGRLLYVVLTDQVAGVSLKAKVADLYQGSSTVTAKRGSILDRYGNPIAEDATSFSVYTILSDSYIGVGNQKLYAEEKNFGTIAQVLAENLGMEESFVLQQLQTKNSDGSTPYQVEFGTQGKNITLEKKLAIEAALDAAKVKGVYFTNHPARLYPNGDFASYLVGYAQLTDKDNEALGLKGIMGIENVDNDILDGANGKVTYEKDHNGKPVPGTVKTQQEAEDGEDIYTTLDSNLQSYLETLMDETYETAQPEDLTFVMVKAKTGEIVAMSQRPSFNPQTGFTADTIYRNFLVEDAYEPGSTMKTMLMAAAINEGVYNPNESYNPAGGIKIYDTTINDHDFGEKGILNMSQAYSWSSNVGMVRLEQELGDEKWLEYLERFGFGATTSSGLSNETTGTVPSDNPVSIAMSAFGQAISVSALQMVQAYTAIANGGEMLKPYYITKTVNNATGEVQQAQPTSLGQVVTADAAASVLQHMQTVVEDPVYGTGNHYALEGYNVGAKTGTAQIAENGKYLTGPHDYIYSVAMLAPVEDPEYIVYATIKKPQNYSGATTLPNLVNPLMKRALAMKEENPTTTVGTVADYTGQEVAAAQSAITALSLQPVVLGTGSTVKSQSIAAGTSLLPASKVLLLTAGDATMPDVTGWSKNDILSLEKILGKEFTIEGQGYVVAQSLSAGATVTDDEIRIILQ